MNGISSRESFLEEEVRCDYPVSPTTKAVWKVELDILEKFIRICDQHHLQYCLIAGSLLGAIRHKGFIPWDDDIDVAMPRPDYDRFLRIAQSELAFPMHLMNVVSDPEWNTDYAQIRNSNTTMLSPYWVNKKSRMNHGIMLDVFCLDGICESHFVRVLQNFVMRLLRNVNWCAFHHCKGWRLIAKPFAWCAYKLLGGKQWYEIRRFVLNWCPFVSSKNCGMIGFMFWETKFQWKTEWFSKFKEVPFEYLMVNVPVMYEQILSKTYGDWHKFVRGGSKHENLYLDPYRSYRDVLVEKFGYKPEWFSEGCK